METQESKEKSFQALHDAWERQPLLKLAFEVYNELHKVVLASLKDDDKNNPSLQNARERFVEGILQQTVNALFYLLKDCISDLDTRAKEKPADLFEFYEPANEVHFSLWKRKFIELLVDTKLFSLTNEHTYYHHYALIHEYQMKLGIKKDEAEFYSSSSKWWDHNLREIETRIIEAEETIDIAKCWYLRNPKPWKDLAPKEKNSIRMLNSLKGKYTKAHRLLSAKEHLITGLTYYVGYGQTSQDIHTGPYGIESENDKKPTNFDASINVLSMFAMYIFDNTISLLKLDDEQWVRKFRSYVGSKEKQDIERFSNFTINPEIEVGDFVLVKWQLAQVRNIIQSDFGYRSFEITFLSKPIIPEILDDIVPAPYLALFLKRSDVANGVSEEIAGSPIYGNFTDEALNNAIAQSAVLIHAKLGANLKDFLAGKYPPQPN